ncbi:nuclear protein localization protein 4 [Quaeritorhiza haematococci]|nr:nuclear protein localization protein 4 [Quaeritorhiza haematococci]
MLFVTPEKSAASAANGDDTSDTGPPTSAMSRLMIKQHPVDDLLEKEKGHIKRTRGNFCKHGPAGMCEYCVPLEPYDAQYLEENKVKHMSYHAYLRQMTTQNKTAPPTSPKFIPPLDEPEFKIKNPCPSKSHGPYPQGICTKCQPSAVVLQSQNFRMVDHVEFESASLIENFLKFWRSTGYQRFGYMYGRYEPYGEVPLGVKAVVSAIYEPAQDGAMDGLQLTLPDPQQATVDELASMLGLTRVGMIYSDLTDDGTGQGTVICKRHADSFFLSSAECIFAADMQLKHPTASKWSSSGKFGSRFVTCVVSGNEEGGIDISAYQVSNNCMAMVRDGIIEASVEPSLMRVRQSSNELYVPEVFYKYKNEYGIMVQEAAKPTFPVEYLLVTLSHGFPQNPSPSFTSPVHFPIENRAGFVETQDMSALNRQLNSGKGQLKDLLSDFHLLLFLKECGVLEKADYAQAIKVALTHQDSEANALVSTTSWQTLLMILESAGHGGNASTSMGGGGGSSSSGGGGAAGSSAAGGSARAPWACRHCTFVNMGGSGTCEMCGLPQE